MKILITAGSTIVPIDKVRVISNIFKGNTGTDIAIYFALKDFDVTLITSNIPLFESKIKLINSADYAAVYGFQGCRLLRYSTYKELYKIMKNEITKNKYDIIIHSAAVSDYEVQNVCFKNNKNNLITLNKSNKISSSHKELYLRMTPTPKIIDLIKTSWKFKGYLVKFKLQVGVTRKELLKIAKKSMIKSNADMIVANCLEWSKKEAYIMTQKNSVKVSRKDLPKQLYNNIGH